MSGMSILVVDDQMNIRKTLSLCLSDGGHTVLAVGTPQEALQELRQSFFDLMFLDLRLGNQNGMDFIEPFLSSAPWLKIVIITAHGTVESAVEAMKLGAADYIEKPFSTSQVRMVTSKIRNIIRLEQEVEQLKKSSDSLEHLMLFDSRNPHMKRTLETAKTAAASEAIILLTGESGTGKSVLAQAVHQWSRRSEKPMGIVSCPSVPSQLLESELFGHNKGSFTGALKDNPGRIALCEGGTLFLDEIADLPLALQPKLLGFIQEKRYERIGDPYPRKADVRIVAATNADLETQVQQGSFREDLYYRLNVIPISVPPLRERKEDIPMLARTFLSHFARINNKRFEPLSPEVESMLSEYSWPGNIRELRNAVERAVILSDNGGRLNMENLLRNIQPVDSMIPEKNMLSLADLEKQHIRRVLSKTHSLQEAATILGIDQTTLWRKRRQYGLS
jgi:NtrC-family two-component system response regulator AlgB